MRRAQAQHIMIFVIGLVVIALVLLFGYDVIKGLNEDKCEIQRAQFSNKLIQAIDRNKAWGSSQIVELQAPCETDTICFIDRRIIDGADGPYLDYLPERARPLIKASVETNMQGAGDQTNVFTIHADGLIQPMEEFSTAAAAIRAPIDGAPSAVCIATAQQQVRMRMSGTGRAVDISKVNT